MKRLTSSAQHNPQIQLNASLSTKLNSLICAYFQAGIEKCSSSSNGEECVRAFYELPKHHYMANTTTQNDAETKFLANYILNGKWLLNKATSCRSVLYVMHDLEMFKKLFLKYEESSSTGSTSSGSRDEFATVEKLFYKHLYALYANPREMYGVLSRDVKHKHAHKLLDQLRQELGDTYPRFVRLSAHVNLGNNTNSKKCIQKSQCICICIISANSRDLKHLRI